MKFEPSDFASPLTNKLTSTKNNCQHGAVGMLPRPDISTTWIADRGGWPLDSIATVFTLNGRRKIRSEGVLITFGMAGCNTWCASTKYGDLFLTTS
jgi:hypothetical protein